MTSISKTRKATIVIFVRHGESRKNILDIYSSERGKYHLTRKGKMQADAVGKELARLPHVDMLYTSPILRAKETADVIAKRIRTKPHISPLLKERYTGKYEGTRENPKIIGEQIRKGYLDWESWDAMTRRMQKFLKLAKKGRITVAVTHGDPIKAALGCLLGKKEKELPRIDDMGVLPGTFTVIDMAREGKNGILTIGARRFPDDVNIVIKQL